MQNTNKMGHIRKAVVDFGDMDSETLNSLVKVTEALGGCMYPSKNQISLEFLRYIAIQNEWVSEDRVLGFFDKGMTISTNPCQMWDLIKNISTKSGSLGFGNSFITQDDIHYDFSNTGKYEILVETIELLPGEYMLDAILKFVHRIRDLNLPYISQQGVAKDIYYIPGFDFMDFIRQYQLHINMPILNEDKKHLFAGACLYDSRGNISIPFSRMEKMSDTPWIRFGCDDIYTEGGDEDNSLNFIYLKKII